jgi:hypothetical protein
MPNGAADRLPAGQSLASWAAGQLHPLASLRLADARLRLASGRQSAARMRDRQRGHRTNLNAGVALGSRAQRGQLHALLVRPGFREPKH